jgi:hypothetical protein
LPARRWPPARARFWNGPPGVRVDLRGVAVPHPVFGLLDGVQWLFFAAAHTERHRAQLIGLKRHCNFPA